jgi:murein DD-endopeptidase MepM/ murein hydrolase activator NlpD
MTLANSRIRRAFSLLALAVTGWIVGAPPVATASGSPSPERPVAAVRDVEPDTGPPTPRVDRRPVAATPTRASRRARTAPATLRPAWVRPMKGTLTSRFGRRWGTAHEGIDITGGGRGVYAASDGIVAEARCASPDCSGPGSLAMPGYGNKVDLSHRGGVVTRYAHLKRFVVRTGQRVKAGQLIGYEGETGNVTGPHLHFEVLVGESAVDPVRFLARRGVHLLTRG